MAPSLRTRKKKVDQGKISSPPLKTGLKCKSKPEVQDKASPHPPNRGSKSKNVEEPKASSLPLKRGSKSEIDQEKPPFKRRPPKRKSGETSTLEKLSPLVVFAHGAAVPSSSDWMTRWKDMLGKALHAVEVITFDYPYISAGEQKAPPKAEKLVKFHSDIVKKAAAKYPDHPLILVGKSMGSRVSCIVAGEEELGASAIVCLGYPLKGTKGEVQDEPLLNLNIPIMFVQGTKDEWCPLAELNNIRKKMKSFSGLHVIVGGNHSFKIAEENNVETKGSAQDEVENLAVKAIAAFIFRAIG